MFLVNIVWTFLLMLSGAAYGAGTASAPPPPAPKMDFSSLPESAAVRPVNQDDSPHQVLARLILDKTELRPGDTARLGLHLTQDKGWHTYWKSNVEVGQPTVIDWGLPDGFTSTPYAYPIPQRFDTEGIVSFGYDNEVLLFTEITVPADAAPGPVNLTATAAWLTCEKNCIPASDVKLSLPVNIVADPAQAPASSYAALFDHYTQQHPTAIADVNTIHFEGALSHSALKFDQTFRLALKATPTDGNTLTAHAGDDPWPTFTPIVSNAEYFLEPKTIKNTDDGGFLIMMEGETWEVESLPQNMVVGGLFQLKVNDEWVKTEFTIPMPWVEKTAETTVSTHPIWALAGGAVVKGSEDKKDEPVAAATPDVRYSLDELGSPELDEALCATMTEATEEEEGLGTMVFMLFMAFLGGLLLNIMPCVLPVLTMKLYGLIEQVDISPKERKQAGLAYTSGIVASFLALAAAVVTLQVVLKQDVGWGFQFQYPEYTAALAAIVFVFGLSLFGVFEIPAFGSNAAAGAGAKEGVVGYFFTGVFATLLATPCSAPFLGTAMGFAFAQPSAFVILFFAMAGLGLASPFIAIAYIPALFKLLPNPGAWMETFKQFMGFTLMATTVWLIDVLSAQVTVDATVGFIAFLAFLGISSWVFGHWAGVAASGVRQLTTLLIATAISVAGGWYFLDFTPVESKMADVKNGKIKWKMFRDDRMASLLNRYREGEDKYFNGRAVFLDFTAEWCLSCKANEKAFLETTAFSQALEETNGVPIKADWTNRDENLTKWLKCFKSAGVPYYAVLPADPSKKAILLGETITTDSVIQALKKGAGL